MTRNDVPISEHPLLDPVDSGVRYSSAFEQYEAAIEAGLDIWAWEQGRYPGWFMANILEWYRGHILVRVHGEDAVSRKMKADAKKKKK